MAIPNGFRFNGATYSLAEVLAANVHAVEFCGWAEAAQPGDVFALDGASCECVDWMTSAIERGRRVQAERERRAYALAIEDEARMRAEREAGCPSCGSANLISTDRNGSGAWRCITCGDRFTEFAHGMSRFAAKEDEVVL